MPAHAEILKSRSKKNPFRVKLIGENSETLMTSECLSTRRNCTKNLLAILRSVNNADNHNLFIVHDFTDKKHSPFRKFYLYRDGIEETVWEDIS